MHLLSSVALLAAVPAALALGAARVVNNCPFGATVVSVGPTAAASHNLTYHGGQYVETFSTDPAVPGRALKVSHGGTVSTLAQLIFSYTLDEPAGRIWYDASNYAEPPAFEGYKIVVESADEACGRIVWEQGTPDEGSQVKDCGMENDVTMTLCAE